MSAPYHGDIPTAKVHIVGIDAGVSVPSTQVAGERISTRRTVTLAAGDDPVQIFPHAPRRAGGMVTVVGTGTDVAYLCDSMSDAQQRHGMIIAPGMVLPAMTGTTETWVVADAGNAQVIKVGVTNEYHGS